MEVRVRRLPILAALLLACAPEAEPDLQLVDPDCEEIGPHGGEITRDRLSLVVPPGQMEQAGQVCLEPWGDPPDDHGPESPLWYVQGDLPAGATLLAQATGEGAEDLFVYARTVGAAPDAWQPILPDALGLPRVTDLESVFVGRGPAAVAGLTCDGSDAPVCEQVELVGAPVDVLFVVDSSCSMAEEQAAMAASFPAMLATFADSGLDWHVGVVTTDMDDPAASGKLRTVGDHRWVDATVADPEATFAAMVHVGIGGSGNEKGLDATLAALDSATDGYNVDFLRPESQIAVIVVSDEDDHGALDVTYWLDLYTAHREEGDTFFHAFVKNTPACVDADQAGVRYLEVARALGGVEWSICAPPFDEALVDTCDAFYGSAWITLSLAADPASIEVTLIEPGGARVPLDADAWVFDAEGNRLRLGRGVHADPGSKLEVGYAPSTGRAP